MLDQNIRNQAEQFVRDIRETDVYKSYTMQLARLKKNPELYKQVNDYRKLNFEMQNAVQVRICLIRWIILRRNTRNSVKM